MYSLRSAVGCKPREAVLYPDSVAGADPRLCKVHRVRVGYGVRMATRPIGSRVSLNYDLMPAE